MSFSTLLISSLLTTFVVGKPIHSLQARATIPVEGYEYAGCYTDSVADRTFTAKAHYDDAMTIEKCASACSDYSWFGVEYGREVSCTFPSCSLVLTLDSASVATLLRRAHPRFKKPTALSHALEMQLRHVELAITSLPTQRLALLQIHPQGPRHTVSRDATQSLLVVEPWLMLSLPTPL